MVSPNDRSQVSATGSMSSRPTQPRPKPRTMSQSQSHTHAQASPGSSDLTATARKRAGSWGHNGAGSNSSRPPKRRAPKACLSCRERKVRCDVMNGGVPCTNCRLDECECILVESQRGKHNNSTLPQPSTPSDTAITVDLDTGTSAEGGEGSTGEPDQVQRRRRQSQAHSGEAQSLHQQSTRGRQASHVGNGEEAARNVPETAVDEEVQREQQPRTPLRQSSQARPLGGTPSGGVEHENPPPTDYLVALAFESQEDDADIAPGRRDGMNTANLVTASASSLQNEPSNGARHPLPTYISAHPTHLSPQDLDYLGQKDCLTIPDDALRDQLLRVYVDVVYPFMPAVDLEDLLSPIGGTNTSGSISLLLFQAIMFASVTFIDTHQLQCRGLESKRAARKIFFNRVKLLYSLDYESNRLTQIQSLLLMTYWYDSDSDDKHTWYWMGIALTTAQVEGLHRSEGDAESMTKLGRLKRRIWWSCVIRDRLLGLGIRRPSRIRDDEYSTEPLTLDDFDLGPPSAAAVNLLGRSGLTIADSLSRKALALICIELSKLCMCIGRILHTQYTIGGTDETRSTYLHRAIVRPKSSPRQAQQFDQCDSQLEAWCQNMAPEARYTPGASMSDGTATPRGSTFTVRLHQGLLYMNYLTAQGALHRPQIFYTGSRSVDLERKAVSKTKVTEAAVAITKLAFDLQTNKQMRYLPTSSIPAFLSAALIHLLNTRSNDEETRNLSIGRFCQCLDALQHLQFMYAAADQAVHIIRNVLENGRLIVPIPVISHPLAQNLSSNKQRGVGVSRVWRPFKDIWNPRVTTAYPSPQPSGQNDEAEAVAAAPVGAIQGVPMPLSGAQDPSAFGGSWPIDIWATSDGGVNDLFSPQTHQGGWCDVGDIFDPGLLNFEVNADFVAPEDNLPPQAV